jgi:cell division septal protein FtsQ
MARLKGKQNRLKASIQQARDLGSHLRRQKSARRSAKSESLIPAVKKACRQALSPALKLTFILLISGVVLLGGYTGLAQCSWFDLQAIEVIGANHLSRLDILSAGKLGSHTSLISLRPSQVEAGIRENLPWIDQVRVSRRLPNKIVIEVTEQKPYAVGLIDGQWFYLNQGLKPFAPYDYAANYSLPVICGLSRAEFLSEDQETEDLLVQTGEVLREMEKMDPLLTGSVSQIEINKEQGIIIVFDKLPAPVLLGFDIGPKHFGDLQQITKDLADRGELARALLVDLSQEKMAIVRLEQNIL